jgi:hypothetical protein
MSIEKRIKELGLQSYGSQAISLTIEYGWIRTSENVNGEYRPTVKLFMWVENGQTIQCEGSSVEKVLDKAEERLSQYKGSKELD